jgi:hypothetical protein
LNGKQHAEESTEYAEMRGVNIKSKLRHLMANLKGIPAAEENTADNAENVSQVQGDPTLIGEIFDHIWLHEEDICIGAFFDIEDIPALVELLFDELLGTWVDQSIVCVGDYQDTLPPGFQSESDTLYDEEYAEVLSLESCAETFLKSLEHHCPKKAESFRQEYARLFETHFPSDQKHVLVNLDRREYVFGQNDFSRRDLKETRDRSVCSLGDAAMARICWSQDPSVSMDYQNWDLVEGQWACHRFAIVSVSVFNSTINRDRDWKDVSSEVYEVLDEVWKAEGYEQG